MTYYLNFKNNMVSIDEKLDVNAKLIEIEALLDKVSINLHINKQVNPEHFAVDLDLFIEKEALKIMDIAKLCTTYDELRNFVLGEGDFLEPFLEHEFNILISDYPDLRDIQLEQFDGIGEKLIINS